MLTMMMALYSNFSLNDNNIIIAIIIIINNNNNNNNNKTDNDNLIIMTTKNDLCLEGMYVSLLTLSHDIKWYKKELRNA